MLPLIEKKNIKNCSQFHCFKHDGNWLNNLLNGALTSYSVTFESSFNMLAYLFCKNLNAQQLNILINKYNRTKAIEREEDKKRYSKIDRDDRF